MKKQFVDPRVDIEKFVMENIMNDVITESNVLPEDWTELE